MASLFKETQPICIDDVGCVTLFPLRIKKNMANAINLFR